jgi:hypothetical protein
LWEISDVPKPDYLKGRVLYDALMAMKPDELLEGDWATGAGLNRGFFTDLKKAAGGAPRSDTCASYSRSLAAMRRRFTGQLRKPD